MFHVELAPWGLFLPSEVRFRDILALSRAWFCNGQKQKCKILKKGSLPDFQILCGDSWGNFTKNGTNLRPGQFFFVFDPYRPLCVEICLLWQQGPYCLHEYYIRLEWSNMYFLRTRRCMRGKILFLWEKNLVWSGGEKCMVPWLDNVTEPRNNPYNKIKYC